MKNIIEDLGGFADDEKPKRQQHKPTGPDNKIDVHPPTFNRIPSDPSKVWTVYLQFDNDQPIPFAFVPNGDVMKITFFEPELSDNGQSAILTFKDDKTNKKLRLFAKK